MKKKKSKKTVILAVTGLLVFLLALESNNFFKNFFIKLTLPLQKSAYSLSLKIKKSLWSHKCASFDENETFKLEQLIEIFKKEQSQILFQENKKLKETLNFLSDNNLLDKDKKNFITAYVSGKDPLDPSLFIINQGAKSGLQKGMPVISGPGIMIGKIAKVEKNISFFYLITNTVSEITASVNNNDNKISGIVKGNYNLSITMELIPIDKDIKKGDIVVTSGTEKFIPAGLLIGKVLSVNKKDNDIFQSAELSPLAPLDNLNIVTVLK